MKHSLKHSEVFPTCVGVNRRGGRGYRFLYGIPHLWALLLLGRRGWLRRNIFAFGAFLMLLGVPLFIYFYLKAAVEIQEFAIVFGVMSLIAAGAAVLGALVCAACVLVSGPRK